MSAQKNPLNVILANHRAVVKKFLALSNHPYDPQSLIGSKKVWVTLLRAERNRPNS